MNPSGSPGRTSALSGCHPQKVQKHQGVLQMCAKHLELPHLAGEVASDGKHSRQEGPIQVSQGQQDLFFSESSLELGWSRSSSHSAAFTAGFVLAKLT